MANQTPLSLSDVFHCQQNYWEGIIINYFSDQDKKEIQFSTGRATYAHDLDLSILYDFHMAFSSSIHGQRIDITFSQHIDIPGDETDI